ncbi:MAG: AMP-binding protein [Candidatus Magnetoovum sp. WYHC-5]|nr:AMP-binding protein [Candidatus Magnetoovum sp. WYHC-5]
MSLLNIFDKYKENTAVITKSGQHVTYKELHLLCEEISAYIEKRKCLIFILCKNTLQTVAAYLANIYSNSAALLLDNNMEHSSLEELINIYKPDYLWLTNEYQHAAYHTIYTNSDCTLIKSNLPPQRAIHPALTLMLTTSGSTGSSKLVRLTLKNLNANAHAIATYLNLNETERPVTTLPMHYSYGLSVINSHLISGATILMTDDSIVTREFWNFVKTNSLTSLAGVPYTYEILKKLRFFTMKLPSLKYITQAGGRLAPELVLEFANQARQRGIDFYVMYGQTEATARISYLPPKDNVRKHKSIGIPIPGGSLTLITENNEKITTPYTEGELIYNGDNVMMGYATEAQDLSKGDELMGRLSTGDIGYFDKEGYFYITGRKKRFLKLFGNRVNLEDIEGFLNGLGFVCVCGGRDDMLLIANTKARDSQSIKKAVVAKYGFHHSVVEVFEIEVIPKSSAGKILYANIFEGRNF